jgi:hypothetical protein
MIQDEPQPRRDTKLLDPAMNEKMKISIHRQCSMGLTQCELCWEDLKADEDKFSFDCESKHVFHDECIRDSYLDFIQRGEVKKLTCPSGCNCKADINEIKRIF